MSEIITRGFGTESSIISQGYTKIISLITKIIAKARYFFEVTRG